MRRVFSICLLLSFIGIFLACTGKTQVSYYPKEDPKEVSVEFLRALFGGKVKKVLSYVYIDPKVANDPQKLKEFENTIQDLTLNTYYEMQNSSLVFNFEATQSNIDKDRAEVIVIIYSGSDISYTRIVKLILYQQTWKVIFR